MALFVIVPSCQISLSSRCNKRVPKARLPKCVYYKDVPNDSESDLEEGGTGEKTSSQQAQETVIQPHSKNIGVSSLLVSTLPISVSSLSRHARCGDERILAQITWHQWKKNPEYTTLDTLRRK